MKKLFIDTTSNKEIIVRLTIDGKIFEEKREIFNNRTQIVLPIIKDVLKEHNLSPYDLEDFEVNPGPGSFTGIRVGASIAQALSFGLGIKKKRIEPKYS